jgi:hypothetical protein
MMRFATVLVALLVGGTPLLASVCDATCAHGPHAAHAAHEHAHAAASSPAAADMDAHAHHHHHETAPAPPPQPDTYLNGTAAGDDCPASRVGTWVGTARSESTTMTAATVSGVTALAALGVGGHTTAPGASPVPRSRSAQAPLVLRI